MPWCSKCGYEYREGVLVCPDCGEALVAELPPEAPPPPSEPPRMARLCTVANWVQADLIETHLRGFGIPCMKRSDNIRIATDFAFTPGGFVEILVPEELLEDARQLVAQAEGIDQIGS